MKASQGAVLANIVSMVNFKGGVGKTTLSVNIAACLASEFGQKVLLVDLDAQANASVWLLGPEKWQKVASPGAISNTSYGFFINKLAPDAVLVPYPETGKKVSAVPLLRLIPASYRMIYLEQSIVERHLNQKSYSTRSSDSACVYLREGIERFREDFDYIIYDCPPNLYYVTRNAISSCDFMLVPCIPDTLSTLGLKMLISRANHLVTQLSRHANGALLPTMLGVVVNKFKQVNELTRGLDELVSTMDEMKKTHRYPIITRNATVFEYKVRDLIVHAEAVHSGKPLCLYKPRSDAYQDVKALTAAIHSAIQEWA